MREKQIANKILEHRKYLLKPLKDNDKNKLKYNLTRQFKIISKLLFSDIPNQVSANSPLVSKIVIDYNHNTKKKTKLCVLSGYISDKLNNILNIREDYWDDLSDAFNLPKLRDKVIDFIDNLNYIYFDLTKQTKHHIFKNTSSVKAFNKFNQKYNKDNKYVILKDRSFDKDTIRKGHFVSNFMTNGDFGNGDISNLIIVTYIPRNLMTKEELKLHKIVYKKNGVKDIDNPVDLKILKSHKDTIASHFLLKVSKEVPLKASINLIPGLVTLIPSMFLNKIDTFCKYTPEIKHDKDILNQCKICKYQIHILDKSYDDYDKLAIMTAIGRLNQLLNDNTKKHSQVELSKYTIKVIHYCINNAMSKLSTIVGTNDALDFLTDITNELNNHPNNFDLADTV